MSGDRRCPKCDNEMKRGFIADYTRSSVKVSRWVEGEPQTSAWVGADAPPEKTHLISTYRCTACGYLESYAPG
jgi:hypothetical protein